MNFFQKSASSITLFLNGHAFIAALRTSSNDLPNWFTLFNLNKPPTQQVSPENYTLKFRFVGETPLENDDKLWEGVKSYSYSTAVQEIDTKKLIQIKLEHKQGSNASETPIQPAELLEPTQTVEQKGGKRWAASAMEFILCQLLFPEESIEFKHDAKIAAMESLKNIIELIARNSYSLHEGKKYPNKMLSALTKTLTSTYENFVNNYGITPIDPVLYQKSREKYNVQSSTNGICGHNKDTDTNSQNGENSELHTYQEGESAPNNNSAGELRRDSGEENQSYHTIFGQSLL